MLELERPDFYRVKSGQTAEDVENTLQIPAEEVFAGEIIADANYIVCFVKPFESYSSIAADYGVEEEALKAANFKRTLYPSRKIFIPM